MPKNVFFSRFSSFKAQSSTLVIKDTIRRLDCIYLNVTKWNSSETVHWQAPFSEWHISCDIINCWNKRSYLHSSKPAVRSVMMMAGSASTDQESGECRPDLQSSASRLSPLKGKLAVFLTQAASHYEEGIAHDIIHVSCNRNLDLNKFRMQ